MVFHAADTILKLKEKILLKEPELAVAHQHLQKEGVDLHDAKSIALYNILPDTLLHLTLRDPSLCVICWEHKATVALVPCGHVCLCAVHAAQYDPTQEVAFNACPICNTAIDRVLPLFFA